MNHYLMKRYLLFDYVAAVGRTCNIEYKQECHYYCFSNINEYVQICSLYNYLQFLQDLQELSPEKEQLYAGIGREFVSLIDTTDMQKVYKMPILYSFY